MKGNKEELERQLETLRMNYIARLPGKLKQIRTVSRTLQNSENFTDALHLLHRYMHNLAGSAGTYDCPDVSGAARRCELVVDSYMDASRPLDRSQIARLDEGLDKLDVVIAATLIQDRQRRCMQPEVL